MEGNDLSKEKVEQLVTDLSSLYEQLLRIGVSVQKAYGKTSPIGKKADQAVGFVFSLKNDLAGCSNDLEDTSQYP
jgi:hypothetical protein